MAAPVSFSRWFGPAKSAFSATAAKVDPHLLVPGAGAALLGSLDAAGDEVWSAVAVPVRHANAGGPHQLCVGDKTLWRAELWRLLRADVAAPIHPEPARIIGTRLADAQDQVQQAVPVPVGQDRVRGHPRNRRKQLVTLRPNPLCGQFVFAGERPIDDAEGIPFTPALAADQHVRVAVSVQIGHGDTGTHFTRANHAELLTREDQRDLFARCEPAVLQAAEHVEAPPVSAA